MTRHISHLLRNMVPSATMEITQRARDMRNQGINVISLSVGEPDFDTPDFIKEAAIQAIRDGHTKYTAVDGIPQLKEAICEKFRRENSLEYTPDQINVSPGGKPVIYNALAATLDPGDEVIIPAPCWVSHPGIVQLLGGKPVIVPCGVDTGLKLTPEKLVAAITPKTRWVILNSPSNPTGAVYSREEYEALGDVLVRNPHVLVLTDEIYEHLIYGSKFVSFAEAVPAVFERTLTMNGVSKAYAMTGWRIGYGGGPEWLISAMSKVMAQTTSNPASISQYAALAALRGDQSVLENFRKAFKSRRDFVVQEMKKLRGFSCLQPGGAFYVYPDCNDFLKSAQGFETDAQLSLALLEKAHIATVPGSAFYGESALRISYAADLATLERAMAKISDFVSEHI